MSSHPEDKAPGAGVPAASQARVSQLEGELHEARRALRAFTEQAPADRVASMGTLAAGIAHEVNNPLGYTLANVGFALEELQRLDGQLAPVDGEGEAELASRLARARTSVKAVAAALQEARQGGDRVRLLVRDLKTFAGADEERRGPLDVRRVVEASINMAFSAIRLRARIVKDYQGSPRVEGNEARLGQVVLNLLLNAAEATPEGDPEHHEIRVVLRDEGADRCVIEVSDAGCGIPPEHHRRVFDPFFTTKAGGGVGLGLSICQAIVVAMGGTIAFESAPASGTTFRVNLKRVVEEDAKPPPSSRRGAALADRRAKVLVIDDEPMMGRAVQRLLAGAHDVEAMTDPVAAVERLRAGARFDLILCDLMMPTLTGMDVHEEVVAIDAQQARRMVFMTGGAYTARAEAFLEGVTNTRLEKPLDRAALRAIVHAHLL
ncbi:MAG TPA: ATP-binding protein [Polyangiaceae bacterium]